jgi:hypothetical protein
MMAPAQYFSDDYFAARDQFRKAAANAGAQVEILPLTTKGTKGEILTVDIAWFGAANPRRLLLHSSGIHGVEGFAGSAIQLRVLATRPELPSPDSALVMVHILNPYGMARLRRVNENNVDLNRNFRGDGAYAGSPSIYATLDPFLNPRTPPASDLFFAKAAYLIARHGMSALKQSIVGGQYDFPKGLFFGGKQLEEGPRKYEAFVKQRLSTAHKAIVIDVHTGLGKFAIDSLFVDSQDFTSLRTKFGQRVTALQPDDGAGYRVDGGLESMIFQTFPRRPIFICQEFGTYSSAKVLHALREENRWHHYGIGNLDHATKRSLKEVFCPADEKWRNAVLDRGKQLVDEALKELSND